MTWPTVPLIEVCVQERRIIRTGERSDLRYIGLESVEPQTGRIQSGVLSKTPDAPEANSFHFDRTHVLYGKLRPYLNKVHVPTIEGKCSTELIPLKPSKQLDRQYLAYFLRSPTSVDAIVRKVAGARMPRADMDFVLSMQIPLPPLNTQREIVDRLMRAEKILNLRLEVKRKGADFLPALYLDTFGDPALNPKKWPMSTVGGVVSAVDYGTSKKASETKEGVPLVRMSNVDYDGKLNLDDIKYVSLPATEVERFSLKAGDILFNRTNSKELVGKTGLWGKNSLAVAASYFIRVRVNRQSITPMYLWAFMNTQYMKQRLFSTARGAIGQANINSKELRAFPIAVPPLSLQEIFSERAASFEYIENILCNATNAARAVFDAMLHEAFLRDKPETPVQQHPTFRALGELGSVT